MEQCWLYMGLEGVKGGKRLCDCVLDGHQMNGLLWLTLSPAGTELCNTRVKLMHGYTCTTGLKCKDNTHV